MAAITCPECGEKYDDQAAFCPSCGFPTAAPLKCSECGAVITGAESVCRCCGAPIENRAAQRDPMTVPMPGAIPGTPPAPSPAPPLKCPECGAVITNTESVCRCCGAPIENAAISMTVPMPNTLPRTPPAPSPAPPLSDPAPIYPSTNIGQSANRKYIFLNIYALLALIPTNIIMFGKIFTIKLGELEYSFGIEGFSDFNANVGKIVGNWGVTGELKDMTTFLGVLKYVFYAAAIISAINFLIGWFILKSGPLTTALTFPIGYAAAALILCIAINYYAFGDINKFLSNFTEAKVTMETSAHFAPMYVFALIGLALTPVASLANHQKK